VSSQSALSILENLRKVMQNLTSDSNILNCIGQSELVNRRIFPRTVQLSLRPIGLYEHQLPHSEYTTRSMNQATYNVDFPLYSTPTPTIRYPQIPANYESAPILLSQPMTSNSTYVHKDTSIAWPFKDSDPQVHQYKSRSSNNPPYPKSKKNGIL